MAVAGVVGRADELGRISDLVRGACDGRFGALVLEGDAGIGKTTLVRAGCETAGEAVLVLPGSCLPMTSVSVPLLGLRSAVRGLPPGEAPQFSGDAGLPFPVAFDDWLSGRAGERPVVLVVDDLHWADEETLDALSYVLAGPPNRRLAVLLTVRSSDVGPDHLLRRWLADARRLPGVGVLPLGPLSRDEMAEEVAAVLGGPAHTSLVDQVFERSAGNPYFARLLVAGLDPGARVLPEHLPEELGTAAVRAWTTLTDGARRLLVALAVGGRPAAGRALARVADVADLGDPGPALREAVDAGLLDVRTDGTYWFHHPLQAEALEQQLLPEDRRILHAGFAAGYAEDVEEGLTADLAETVSDHHLLAGQPDAAYDWALIAADAMDRARDRPGMLRMLRRAASLHPGVEEGARAPLDLLADVRVLADDLAEWETELEAIDAMLPLLDERVDAQALRSAALRARRDGLCLLTGRGEGVGDLGTALELSRRSPRSWERLYVLAEHVHLLVWDGHDDRARAEAATLQALLDDPAVAPDPPGSDAGRRARAYALSAVAMAVGLEDSTAMREVGARAADAAAEVRDGLTLLDATFWEANSHTYLSSGFLEVVGRRRRQMEELGVAHAYIAWLSAAESMCHYMLGQTELGAERLRVSLGADPGPAGDFLARLSAAWFASWEGRQPDAEAHLARAREIFEGATWFPAFYFDATVATVDLFGGRPAAALEAALTGLADDLTRPTFCEWLAPLAARALADLCAEARDLGTDPQVHLTRLDDLRTRHPHVVPDVGEQTERYLALLSGLDAVYDAETARARGDAGAADAWLVAVERLGEVPLPWEQANACWRAGEALLSGTDAPARRQAAAVLREGHGVAVRLGAEPVRKSIEALARSARIPLTEVVDPALDGGLGALTRREREVLSHVVAGRTYAEIASALFLSEKTVSSHISNILRKTGTANRVELAAWATRRT